jgi:hypothetical protein
MLGQTFAFVGRYLAKELSAYIGLAQVLCRLRAAPPASYRNQLDCNLRLRIGRRPNATETDDRRIFRMIKAWGNQPMEDLSSR